MVCAGTPGSALCRLGFAEDDVIAFFMTNCPDYITCLTGVIGIGAVATPINPNYTVAELAKQLEMSKSKAIITESSTLPLVKKALEQIKCRYNSKFSNARKILITLANAIIKYVLPLTSPNQDYRAGRT